MMNIASFDVFDTLLTRPVGEPTTLFLLLGKRLFNMSLISYSPEAFARARIDAQDRTYKNANEPDGVTLRQIYIELGNTLRVNETKWEQLMNQECILEAELICPVPGAKEQIAEARKYNKRVVFISDMYLPTEFIQQQLYHHGLWQENDVCYVSGDRGKSKRSGKLFQEAMRCEGGTPERMTHCGNHPQADILAAKRIGLQVEPFPEGNLNRYEKKLESYAWATEGLSSAMAGASRLARLSVSALDPKQEALRDVSAGVVGPVLVGYTLWILQRAQQLGLKRLYFLSREGQILHEIACRLASKLNISCELRYLYGSRIAWNSATISKTTEEQLSWIWDVTDFFSVEVLLKRVGIDPVEIKDSLISIGLTEKHWSRKLSLRERKILYQQMLHDANIQELILQRTVTKKRLITKYFKQESLLDSTPYGVIDIGWQGSMYYALSTILAELGKKPPVGFYFAMTGHSPLDPRFDMPETYFFNERRGIGLIDVPGGKNVKILGEEKIPWRGLVTMLEMFCSGDHGTVVEFAEAQDSVEPVFQQERNQQIIDWGLPMIRKTVYSFVDNLLLDSSLINPWADVRPAIAGVLRTFWLTPSLSEAMAWGDFPFEDGMGQEAYWSRLANSYCWKHVIRAFQKARIYKPHRHVWFEGSLALSPLGIRVALKSIVRFRRNPLKIRRFIRKFLIVNFRHNLPDMKYTIAEALSILSNSWRP